MTLDLKKTLLAGTAIFAVAAFSANPAFAQATELDNGVAVTTGNVDGLVESDSDNATVTLDLGAAGSLTFGANDTASVSNNGTSAVVLNLIGDGDTDGTVTNTVVFADDVVNSATGTGITINVGSTAAEDGGLTLQGNVTESAAGSIAINLGDGLNTDDVVLTVDGANDENLTIQATIAGSAGDTTSVVVSESDGNTITFSENVGDSNLDGITVTSDGATNFNGNVATAATTGDLTSAGTGTTTVSGTANIGNDVAFSADGAVVLNNDTISVGNDVTTGTGGEGSLTLGTMAGTGQTYAITGNLTAHNNELNALTVRGDDNTLDVDGNFEAANTTTFGTNDADVQGTFDADAGQTLSFGLDGETDAEFGAATVTGNVTIDADTAVGIVVGSDAVITDGATFVLVDGSNAGAGGVATLTAGGLTDDSVLLSFTQDADADSLSVTAARASGASLGSTTNNANVIDVLNTLGAGGDAGLDGVQGALQSASTAAELNDTVESLGPTIDGGSVLAGFEASALSLDANNTRLASLRNGEAGTGMVAGEMGNGMNVWFKGFARYSEQDVRDGIDGYEADTYGGAVGIDTENLHENAVVGVALSYANTEVDSDNANRTNSDIDSYQITLYGDYDLDQDAYVSGMLAYGHNEIDQTRSNVGGTSGNTATSEFDSQQYIAYAEVGRDYDMGGDLTLTPHVSAHYQHITIDDYTETGSTANLRVDHEDMDVLEFGIGVTAQWDIEQNDGAIFQPSVNVGYSYDVIGDEVEASSNFTGGGASFRSQGVDPAQSTFDAGVGLAYEAINNWTFSADYNYEVKSDFDAHEASLRAGYSF